MSRHGKIIFLIVMALSRFPNFASTQVQRRDRQGGGNGDEARIVTRLSETEKTNDAA
jgi:hypothetical protein